jgi:acyl carrier protein
MIEKKLEEIFINTIGIDKKKLKSKDLISENILDSFNLILLTSEIKKIFKININEKNFQIKNFKNFSLTLKFIKTNLKRQ